MRIHVGKNRRPVSVEVWVCRDDTRWHVYPNRGTRFLEAIVLGEVYRRNKEGTWFKNLLGSGIRQKRASGALLQRLGVRESIKQIETAINAKEKTDDRRRTV